MAKKLSLKSVPKSEWGKTRDGLKTLLVHWKVNFDFCAFGLEELDSDDVMKVVILEGLLKGNDIPGLAWLLESKLFPLNIGILYSIYGEYEDNLVESYKKAFNFFVENWPELVAEE